LSVARKGGYPIDRSTRPDLSIVIPAKDEQETIRPLYQSICETLDPLDRRFEIIFIDDGSTDDSFARMRQLHEENPRVKALRFYVNRGKSLALAAGFDTAKGALIVTIDADLQDDPAEIPKLLQRIEEGFDLVSGWKRNRADPLLKRLFSRLFNAVVSRASGIPLHDFNCGLKCYRREILDCVKLYGGMHRFIPMLAGWYGFRITEVPVTHHPRRTGKSKFGFGRIWRGLLDFGTVMFLRSFAQRPAHLFGLIGLIAGGLGLLVFLTGLVSIAFGHWSVGGFGLAVGTILLLFGLQAVFLGFSSELLTFFRRHDEPFYTINERLDE